MLFHVVVVLVFAFLMEEVVCVVQSSRDNMTVGLKTRLDIIIIIGYALPYSCYQRHKIMGFCSI